MHQKLDFKQQIQNSDNMLYTIRHMELIWDIYDLGKLVIEWTKR